MAQGYGVHPGGTRPNPFLGAGFFWFTNGNTSYNALETEVTHRLSHGLQFRANYTWSKNLDINSALTGAQANNQAQMVMDRTDLRRDWGPSSLNATNQASVSARYELPVGKGKHWLGNVSGIEEQIDFRLADQTVSQPLLSGFPFTPLIGSNRSGDGDTRNPDRPSLNANFSGPVVLGTPQRMVQSERFRSA